MSATVDNIKKETADIYCGRPTIYSNPFKIGQDGAREEVISKYIDYFVDRIANDPWFKSQILKLKDKKLDAIVNL